MANRKRQIAGVLSLGATVTGAVGSATTSAGLFDWFSSKKDLEKKRKEKQEKGYDAAIEIAKNIYATLKEEKVKEGENEEIKNVKEEKIENNKGDEENRESEDKSFSVPKILGELISTKERVLLKGLGVELDEQDNTKELENVSKIGSITNKELQGLENYFYEKVKKLQSITESFIQFGLEEKNQSEDRYEDKDKESKNYMFTTKSDSENHVTINGDIFHRILVLKSACDKFYEVAKDVDESKLVEELINIAKEDTLGQFEKENSRKPVLNLSYEDIIKNLVENTMKDGQITYRDDFYKIFKVKDDDKENTKATNVATVLHGLGYEENMSLLPGYSKEKGGLSIGRIARSFGPSAVVWALGYLYPPVTVVGGVAGLLCNAVVKQSASSLWENLRHKETRTSYV